MDLGDFEQNSQIIRISYTTIKFDLISWSVKSNYKIFFKTKYNQRVIVIQRLQSNPCHFIYNKMKSKPKLFLWKLFLQTSLTPSNCFSVLA